MHGTICQIEWWSSLANYWSTLQNFLCGFEINTRASINIALICHISAKSHSGFLPADLCNSQLLFIFHKVNYLFNYNPAVDISIYNLNGIFFGCFQSIHCRNFISSRVTWTSRGTFLDFSSQLLSRSLTKNSC